MKFLISHGQAIRSVFGRSRVIHFTTEAPFSVEVDVNEQRGEAADQRGERNRVAAVSAERPEAEYERGKRGREHAQHQIPEQRRDQRRGSRRNQHTEAPFAEHEAHAEQRERGRGGDPPGDRAPILHQAGSRPSSSARFLNSYRPSNSGPVSDSIVSSSLVIDRPRSSTSRPGASGASKRSSARSASCTIRAISHSTGSSSS